MKEILYFAIHNQSHSKSYVQIAQLKITFGPRGRGRHPAIVIHELGELPNWRKFGNNGKPLNHYIPGATKQQILWHLKKKYGKFYHSLESCLADNIEYLL